MSTRSFAAFLNEVKSDETLARDLKSALVSVNKNEIPGIVAELAHRKGIEVDIESLQASIQASMNITSAPEFSDEKLEITGSCYRCYTSRKASVIKTCECE